MWHIWCEIFYFVKFYFFNYCFNWQLFHFVNGQRYVLNDETECRMVHPTLAFGKLSCDSRNTTHPDIVVLIGENSR
jgi:hypothetical protein